MFIENRIRNKRNETDSCKLINEELVDSRKTCYLLFLSKGFSVQKKWENNFVNSNRNVRADKESELETLMVF